MTQPALRANYITHEPWVNTSPYGTQGQAILQEADSHRILIFLT